MNKFSGIIDEKFEIVINKYEMPTHNIKQLGLNQLLLSFDRGYKTAEP